MPVSADARFTASSWGARDIDVVHPVEVLQAQRDGKRAVLVEGPGHPLGVLDLGQSPDGAQFRRGLGVRLFCFAEGVADHVRCMLQ
ncbi:hypothetical protein [Streptomyces caeruleatus]|uniref:hypothetical protein n=1 Tax=Streptomyces caeruleatus TaxID=661399 RepID=UPI001FC9A215|nr:hypothetical protein [Streptomyces caeruleatus]